MTEYDPQLTEALEQDYLFLATEIKELQQWLRENEDKAEDLINTEEYGLFWLVSHRAKEYGITPPEPTIVNTYLVAREVARETKRLHSKQMIALIRRDLNEGE